MSIEKYIMDAISEGRAEKINRNKIDWILITEPDGWMSIIQSSDNRYIPKLQACNRDKALDYIEMVEPMPYPIERLA